MSREYRFPVDLEWAGGRRTIALVDEKEPLVIATPPEFNGTHPDLWSPEDAVVTAAGACLTVTIAALAERERLPLHHLEVHAEGVVGRRDDGHFGFVRIEQHETLATDAGYEQVARDLLDKADTGCLVAASLNLPVETTADIRTLTAAPPG